MSDMIEDFKALGEFHREERKAGWDTRAAIWFKPIFDAGWTPQTLSETSRHCGATRSLVAIYFHFWPSTGRWAMLRRNPNNQARRLKGGHDISTMLTEMRALS